MMQELNYIRCGDYYIPDIHLPEENRPMAIWSQPSMTHPLARNTKSYWN